MKKLILMTLCASCSALYGQSGGGLLLTSTVVCKGNNNGVLTVASYSGSIIRWEYALGATGPWSTMAFTSSSYNYINLGQSTYFRVAVQLSGYPEAFSNTVVVMCDEPSNGGSILTSTLNCINAALQATVTGFTGTVVNWDYSLNNWVTRTTIVSNSPVFTINAFSVATAIRARVQNGSCPPAFAPVVNVVPAPATETGTVSGAQGVCAGSNSGTLALTGNVGNVQYWESAASVGGPYFTVNGSAGKTSMSYTNLMADTWYRVAVQNANCAVAISAPVVMNVDQPGSPGTIVGTSTVCAGVNSGTLKIVGNTAAVTDWEFSTNNGANFSTTSNSAATQTFVNLSLDRLYRTKLKNGVCAAIYSNTFLVSALPLPASSFSANSACAGAAVTFSNASAGSTGYFWEFGDGSTSGFAAPSYKYSSDGVYLVKLHAYSAAGCTGVYSQSLVIHPRPVASFVCADTACFGTAMTFVNNSTISGGSVATSQFFAGGANGSASINPAQHFFSGHGVWAVKIVVKSAFGCADSMQKPVMIFPKPHSSFAATNNCLGTPITFSNNSAVTYGSLQSFWSFGNGFNSVSSSPVYLYPKAGSYTISLISVSDHNCKDTTEKQLMVNEAPVLGLTLSNVCVDDHVVFKTAVSPPVTIKSHTLYYGDGNYSGNHSYKYHNPGNYLVSYCAMSDSGCVSSVSASIIVFPRPKAAFNIQNVCAGDSVLPINLSITSATNNYEWEFLPGVFIQKQVPAYLYSSAGDYLVSLIVTSDDGCRDSLKKSVKVYERPVAGFSSAGVCDGDPVNFLNTTARTNGASNYYKWEFGDNTESLEESPVKQFLNYGVYAVTLTAQSVFGCSDTVVNEVTVFEGPVADFSAGNNCLGTMFQFENRTILKSGSFTSVWTFGDSASAAVHSPSHSYGRSGAFNVFLNVTSDKGCMDSLSRFVAVYPSPRVFAGNDTIVEKGNTCRLRVTGASSYTWYPSQGFDSPTTSNPSFRPAESNTYVVYASDKRGCENTDTVIVRVKEEFMVIPYNILTPDGNSLNDSWHIRNIESYPLNRVSIIDQWGQEVYTAKGYANEWTGKNQQGDLLPDGTYYYVLTFDNSDKKYAGYITLMRNSR